MIPALRVSLVGTRLPPLPSPEASERHDAPGDLAALQGGVLGSQVVWAKADAPDATAATSEAERLVNVEKVKIIYGSYSSALSFAASEVSERILKLEHAAYPKVVDSFAKGRYAVEGRRVRYEKA